MAKLSALKSGGGLTSPFDIVIEHHGSDYDFMYATVHKDIFFGSQGQRAVSYAHMESGVTINMNTGLGYRAAAGDQYHGIKKFTLTHFDDVVYGNFSNNQIYGFSGNDYIKGGGGNDYLRGDAGQDQLFGGSGWDRLEGGWDDDFVSGGGGRDNIFGGGGEDILKGGQGRDNIYGGDDDDYLFGGVGKDRLFGGDGDDELDGGTRDDYLSGGSGADQIDGGSGNDTVSYYGSEQGVEVNLQTGTGNLGDAQGDTISNVENAQGSRFDDKITGDDDDNELTGYSGSDILIGGAGDDILYGHGEYEADPQGEVTDTFVFANNQPGLSHGNDTIMDFEAGIDKIDLSDTNVNSLGDLLNGGARYMEQVGNDTVIYTNDGVDGDSITLKSIDMDSLAIGDFIF